MSIRKVSDQEKISAVLQYLDGKTSQDRIANELNVSKVSVQQWIRNYQVMGPDVFLVKHYKKYTKELKVSLKPLRRLLSFRHIVIYHSSLHLHLSVLRLLWQVLTD